MRFSTSHDSRLAPSASTASVVASLFVHERDMDTKALTIPRAETQIVFRFGPSPQGGIDAHAIGSRQRVHRKLIHGGHGSVTARLHLGAQQAVLGVPASQLTDGIVALEDLWGDTVTRRLYERLSEAREPAQAAAIVEGAIAERLRGEPTRDTHLTLALDAARRLSGGNVNEVARDLGVSDRHLRRVFREALGVSPKSFAQLARFRHALRVAREDTRLGWASIAVAAGYYDQAHLIAEFRAIADATPRVLLQELRASARTTSAP